MTNHNPNQCKKIYLSAVRKGWTDGPSAFWAAVKEFYSEELSSGWALHYAAHRFTENCIVEIDPTAGGSNPGT
jgi:hypothetical protein